MKWMRENSGKICIIAAVIFFLITASVSSYRIGEDEENDSAAELSIQELTADIQTPFSGMMRKAGDFFSDLMHFREYSEENSRLKEENTELKKALSEAQMSQNQLQELRELSDSLNYSGHSDNYHEVGADVISLDESGIYGTFTISAGSRDGVEKGNVVTSSAGLVGRISSVAEKHSKVSGIINNSISVSFYVQGQEDVIGIVTGDGRDGLTGYLLDNGKTIDEGAVLMTSGLGRYPAGIEIGTVMKVNKDKTTSQVNISAEPSVDFYSAGIVAVLVEK